MFSVSQTKSFEASHYLEVEGSPDCYRHVHGHSFVVTVTCSADRPTDDGWVVDLGQLDKTLSEVVGLLDHKVLNDIEGLAKPTFETIMQWIANQMSERGLSPSRVEISRPTLGQSASYTVAS